MNHRSTSELASILELRVFLERHCARLAAHRVTERQLQQMESVLAALGRLPDGDVDGLIAIDKRFHRLLYAAADNAFMADVLERLYDLSLPIYHLLYRHPDNGRPWIEQHRKVLDALKVGDTAQAEALVEEHVAEYLRSSRAVV